ncbi:hypothetical protein RND81_04G105500 [Saponaria officinalis]|uniref:DOMON domain-containing protein n=1 Tax=Saponaria officinalis TaxID=3572 RepID=A0AAW1LI81_SAPOF
MACSSRFVFVFVFSVFFLITTPAVSQTTPSCKTITTKKTFDNCIDLPTLNAVLQYTYDPTESTLSMGFTAPTSVPDGWVAWALNPKATGMAGSQTLIAFKPTKSGPITVNTYDIVSYGSIIKGPISYNVTGLSTEESNGVITIFATWLIPRGEKSVNVVWQVGPVEDGKPGAHDFTPDNLGSTMKLSLAASKLAAAPAMSPTGAPTATVVGGPVGVLELGAEAPGPAPSKQSGGAKGNVVSMLMVLGALLICLL